MKRMVSLSAAAVLLCASGTLAASADVGVGPGGGTPGTSSKFQLVGHDPLFGRGMNAALALYSDSTSGRTFVYVGNRTDGSKPFGQTGNAQPCHASSNVHTHPQILIEDVTHPSAPVNVRK